MNVSRGRGIALATLVLLALAGCRQSRISDSEAIDVCALVTAGETQRIFGAATTAPAPAQAGFAGGCIWSFQAAGTAAHLTATVMTRASAEYLMTTPKGWFENPAVVGEAKANLGEPSEPKGLGFVARLYGTRLFARKGEIVILLYTDGGDAAQMEQVAQTLLN